MISDFTRNAIPQLVDHELEYSKNQHEEQFHSLHEAESVIREELEELEENVKSCRLAFDDIHALLRQTGTCGSEMKSVAVGLRAVACEAAQEAIQLAAMGEKLYEWNNYKEAMERDSKMAKR